MNIKTPLFPTTKETFYPFYGALYGRIASLVKPDTITYLSNETINNMEVYNYEKSQIEKIYQKDYLNHIDSYDIFLSGATPLLIINNPSANNNRELIIFRDSFGSSITPILAESYKKVTLIDLRYINSSLLKDIEEIKFNINNQDILFLYSIPVINDSFALK